jgi:hypothetical protein
MKLINFAKIINDLAKEHPNATVVYACDEEGNHFSPAIYGPAAGHFSNGSFDATDEAEVNAVCIN